MPTLTSIHSELFLARAIAAEASGCSDAAELLLLAAVDMEVGNGRAVFTNAAVAVSRGGFPFPRF